MDVHDEIEVVRRHVPDRPVAHDAGIVDDDVELAVRVDGLLHHIVCLLLVADVAVVRRGGAASSLDDADDHVGISAATLTADRRADIVDDHCGAVFRDFERMAATDAVAGSGDEGDPSFEEA